MIELDNSRLESLVYNFPPGSKLYMINLLRFRQLANYYPDTAPIGTTGRDAYFDGYIPAFQRVCQRLGITEVRPVWVSAVAGVIVGGSDEEWHNAAIVEYPDALTFKAIVESPDYHRDAAPYRRAALEAWRLLGSLKIEPPM